jgi:hypothetical protein
MDPDQTVRMCRLIWIHVGRQRTMLVSLWHGSLTISWHTFWRLSFSTIFYNIKKFNPKLLLFKSQLLSTLKIYNILKMLASFTPSSYPHCIIWNYKSYPSQSISQTHNLNTFLHKVGEVFEVASSVVFSCRRQSFRNAATFYHLQLYNVKQTFWS